MFNAEDPRKFRLMTILIMMVIVLILVIGSDNFGSDVRLFNDYYDRSKYAERGLWSITSQIPYVDIQSEYPQIPIFLFGVITWLARLIIPSSWPITIGFVFLWVVFIMVISILAIWQLWRMLPIGRKNLAWLMFLPSAIYFSLNRFDILPVYIGLLGVAALKKDRFAVAAVLLALGVFTKWYLVLIFPFFLAYELNHTRKLPWRSVLIFLGVSIAIVLPTFIQGGFQAVWQPYSWHLARMVEPGTLLWFFYQLFGHAGEQLIKPGSLATIFTFLGFGGVLLVFFLRFDSITKVILASIISLLLFISVTRIFSPQWWLWVLPFLIITCDKLLDLILIVIYDLTNYAAFPVAYDLSGRDSIESLVLHGVLIVLMMVLIIRTVWKIHAHDASPDFRKRMLHA